MNESFIQRKLTKKLRDSNRIKEIDPNYEFDAPKFKDLTKIVENFNSDYINPWFLIDNRNNPINKILPTIENQIELKQIPTKENKNENKRNSEEFDKEENNKFILKNKNSKRKLIHRKKENNLKIENFANKTNTTNNTNINSKLDSKENFKETKQNFNNRVNRFENNNNSSNLSKKNTYSIDQRRPLNSVSNKNKNINTIQYCPRIHSASLTKKWETITNKKWYNLSPTSRHAANNEISEMVKKKQL